MKLQLDVYFVTPFVNGDAGSGNPAAVCIVNGPIAEATMSYIAETLNQPETVFARKRSEGTWELRWYTPAGDAIAPGGNGTVAASYVLLNAIEKDLPKVTLLSEHRQLDSWAERSEDGLISVALPSVPARQVIPAYRYVLSEAFSGYEPQSYLAGQEDLIMVFDSEEQVRSLVPNFSLLVNTDYVAYIVTAKGEREGFVYRTFLTSHGRKRWECPGSARALMNLVPYWAPLLGGKQLILAQQLSKRGGEAQCRLADCGDGDCVIIKTKCELVGGPSRFVFDAMGGESDDPDCSLNHSPLIWC
ncbi:MAG: PhzF family phenazine biosynthesis protein [Candidatus Obscuribacter sp.]|nr:PhzF family phenazine biosynthesis protein [Candidatus Melainabacteria bacterium]MDX1987524.1 PhzF family phenazine biosynthesis protein [Candidatus Obscuribacter sp.]